MLINNKFVFIFIGNLVLSDFQFFFNLILLEMLGVFILNVLSLLVICDLDKRKIIEWLRKEMI